MESVRKHPWEPPPIFSLPYLVRVQGTPFQSIPSAAMPDGPYGSIVTLIFVIGISTYMGIGAAALMGVVLLAIVVGSTLWEKVQGDEDE